MRLLDLFCGAGGAAMGYHAGPQKPSESPVEAPEVIFQNETPSGILVEYSPNPRFYRVNGTEVPSVTTVLNVLRKDLTNWAMKGTVQGMIELFDMGLLTVLTDFPDTTERMSIRGEVQFADADRIVAELRARKLTPNDLRDKAGDRGTSIHKLFEKWAETGDFSFARFLEPHEQGYAKGLEKFVREADPTILASEVMVGSVKHGYAGRLDVKLTLGNPEVFTHVTPKGRGDKKERVEDGVHLADLKTSSGVWDSHHLQPEGYEGASVECGYEPTDHRYILRVTEDGRYEYVKCKGSFDKFLAVKAAYDAVKGLT